MNRSPSHFLASSFIEIGIGRAGTKDAGGFSINFLVDSFRFGLRGLVRPEPIFIGLRSGFKTRLVDDSESVNEACAERFALSATWCPAQPVNQEALGPPSQAAHEFQPPKSHFSETAASGILFAHLAG